MNDNENFEAFIFVGVKKFAISINKKKDFKKIYFQEITFDNEINKINLDLFNKFLSENIFKIEKIIKDFIKNVYLIIESNDFFIIDLSIKKNVYNNLISSEILIHLLKEAKESCKTTLQNRKIVHMMIKKYIIDNNDYLSLPISKKCNSFSIDIKFISLSIDFIKDLEKILKNYQISLIQVLSADHIREHSLKNEDDIFFGAHKILNGYNKNEVIFVEKKGKNKGFFEKFFHFFN